MPGLFITFEGTEGSGKSTQVEMIGEWLSSRDPVVVREPGGTELGERIREVVLYAGLEIDAEAEMYLFMAGRRQLIAEVIAMNHLLKYSGIDPAERFNERLVRQMAGKSDVLRRPDDARDQISYKGAALGKTDRFVLVLRKEAGAR